MRYRIAAFAVCFAALAFVRSAHALDPPALVAHVNDLAGVLTAGERQALEAIHKALKPGGVLGIVGHRGDPKIPQDPKAASGYVNEEHAIRLIESAGFRLVARSEINANPKDTKDYEQGVWTLPPGFADGDAARYRQIGESDRFTVNFVKQ